MAAVALIAPQAAGASSTQLSLIQDGRELLSGAGASAAAAIGELRLLGVDIVRTNVVYNKIYRTPTDRRKPRGTGAIGSPLPMLRAALCLDADGRPFTGRLKALHGCSGRVSRLNVGGFAVHPNDQGAYGSPRSSTRTKTSLPLAYMPRLHRLIDGAARLGRIGRGKGVFVTEFGYQTNPPDPFGVSLSAQSLFVNESDRLFFSDRRIKSVAQYELTDVPQREQFNTGLRFAGGAPKPAYAAYRLPIVVTRRSPSSVEVYGQVRPRRVAPGLRPQVQVSQGGGPYVTVATPGLNSRGIFRMKMTAPEPRALAGSSSGGRSRAALPRQAGRCATGAAESEASA